MTMRFALVLLVACALILVVGCKRLGTKPGAKVDPCSLLTDDEMTRTAGAKVAAHRGGASSCDWSFVADPAMSVHLAILTPLEAKIIPQLGKPEPVSGLGDSAEWSGGFAPQLRVTKGDKVLHVLMTESHPQVTIQEGPSHTVKRERNAQGGETTLSTNEETIDYPELKVKMMAIAKVAITKM